MSHVPDNQAAVEVSGLKKRYGSVQALDGVSLAIAPGEVFGYLGPNGAGKTTTVNILCGLLPRDAGSVAIGGVDVAADPVRVKARIGVVTDSSNLYPELTCRRNLEYLGELYGLGRTARRGRAQELLEMVGLADRAADRFDSLSRGMKRRLTIAAALVHRPPILFLDEPTVGLDVPSARSLREFIRQVHRQGTTVLLTTHNLAEAESLCDRVGVLMAGRIVAEGTVSELCRRFAPARAVSVAFSGPVAEPTLRRHCPSVHAATLDGGAWRLEVVDLGTALAELGALAGQLQVAILEVNTAGAALDDAFMAILDGTDDPGA